MHVRCRRSVGSTMEPYRLVIAMKHRYKYTAFSGPGIYTAEANFLEKSPRDSSVYPELWAYVICSGKTSCSISAFGRDE